MIIALARYRCETIVTSTDGTDLGRAPKTKVVRIPEALVWLSGATEADLPRAEEFAARECYTVFTYPDTEADPLGRARSDLKFA